MEIMEIMEITVKNQPEIWNGNKEVEWKTGICKFKLNSECRSKKYKVQISSIENKILLKPFQKYYEYEFEHLFRFQQPSCNDYDENRIVYI